MERISDPLFYLFNCNGFLRGAAWAIHSVIYGDFFTEAIAAVHSFRCYKEQIIFESNYLFFFSIWVLFHEHSRITGLQGKGEGISLTPHYHFHPLHRHLDISRAITAESSPLYIASSRTRTGNLWFPSASHLTTKLLIKILIKRHYLLVTFL